MEREEMAAKLGGLSQEWTRILAQHGAHECDWGPLEKALPRKWCGGFMFMGYEGKVRLYKHGFTRRYLNLDPSGRAYRWTGERYVPMPLKEAIDHVFEGLKEMGETRSSVYDDAAVKRRHEALERAGWEVVRLGAPDSGPEPSPSRTERARA